MSRRQIQLQAINRSLQHKILLLKQQNTILSERQEDKYRQMEAHLARVVTDKENIILNLQQQLSITIQQITHSRRDQQQDGNNSQELQQCHRKCTELQRRLQATSERYQMRVKELEGQNSRLQEKWQEQSSSHALLSSQLNQLSRHYVHARSNAPIRKHTLQWVEKLMEMLDSERGSWQQEKERILEAIKGSICGLKHDIAGSIQAANSLEQDSIKQRKSITQEIRSMIEEQNEIGEKVLADNEKFWDAIRREKQSVERERIKQLEAQLKQEQEKWEHEIEELASKLKSLQNQRKTLFMGFSELKNLNQTRQKTFRDENAALKSAIDSLLEKAQHRQLQYSKQTHQLHDQLATISRHYYDNIEIPFQRVLQNLDTEIKKARGQLQKLSDNKCFNHSAQKLEGILQKYMLHKSRKDETAVMIGQYVEHSTRLLDALQTKMEELQWSSADQADKLDQRFRDRGAILHQSLRQLQMKESMNKLHYEVATLKKHNSKLKDYASSLEAKLRQMSPAHSRRRPAANTPQARPQTATLFSLQGQIQRLQLQNRAYRQQYLSEVDIMRRKLQNIKEDNSPNYQASEIKEGVLQLRDFNERLVRGLECQHKLGESINELVINLNTLLAKPSHIFDTFLARVELQQPVRTLLPPNYQQHQMIHPLNATNIFAPLRQSFADIAIKKQQVNASTQRLVNELIRVMRDTAPAGRGRKDCERKKEEKEERKERKEGGVEKRVREVQSQRIKLREEVMKRLEKIEEGFKTWQSKAGKKPVATVAKLSQYLDKKISALEQRYLQGGRQAAELSEIAGAALRDTKDRLRECMVENEGLCRQVQCLRQIRSSE